MGLKNGYFKFANDVFEQLFIREFTLLQLKMLLLIVRFSYGFHKRVAVIKPQRMFELAYIYRCDIKEELKYLKQNKVITCNFQLGEFSINKNYDEWKIPFHKLFNEEDIAKLKKLNFEAKNIAEIFEKPDEVTPEECLQKTNNFVCAEQTEPFVNNKQVNPETIDGESISGVSKDREIIEKDNNTYIYNYKEEQKTEKRKKDDPFYGHIQKVFCEEYKKVFKRNCFLNYAQKMALVEIDYENPDFEENLPILIEKFSKIKFKIDGKEQKVGLRWLIEQGNWSGVLSGDFDGYMETDNETVEQKTYSREEGWDL